MAPDNASYSPRMVARLPVERSLLMFAVGTGNVGWMMGLGAVMAIEKNMSGGSAREHTAGRRAAGLGLCDRRGEHWRNRSVGTNGRLKPVLSS